MDMVHTNSEPLFLHHIMTLLRGGGVLEEEEEEEEEEGWGWDLKSQCHTALTM